MKERMENMRRTAGLAIAGFCLISVLVGASLRPALGRANLTESKPPPAYFDFEAEEQHHRFIIPADGHGALRLLVRPSRSEASGLQVDIEVWNLSDDTKLIDPIDPARCPIEFRNADGKSVLPYRTPSATAYPVELMRSEEVQLRPANRLGATYLLPHFYTRVEGMKNLKVKANLFVYYHEDEQARKTIGFQLCSGWVDVPPP